MGKTTRNEQAKLSAMLLNAVAAGVLVAVAVATFGGLFSWSLWLAYSIAIGSVIALHLLARAVLRRLED